MTLNITVVTPKRIYQCADYRYKDLRTGAFRDHFERQKIFLVSRKQWHATVCFNGVGSTHNLDVSTWLEERLQSVHSDEPFDRLIDQLKQADEWLRYVPPPHNRHSFVVGAFIGVEALFALVTNYEHAPRQPTADRLLYVKHHPNKAKTYVSGQPQAVTESQRWRLANLADRNPDHGHVVDELAGVNRTAAKRLEGTNPAISAACYTTYVDRTGGGTARSHDVPEGAYVGPPRGLPGPEQAFLRQFLEDKFGPGGGRVVQVSMGRFEPTEAFHKVQLADKPDVPATHYNYGAFLRDVKGDIDGAEAAYRTAISLNPNEPIALANLGQLLASDRRKFDEAKEMFIRALDTNPGHEIASYQYARLLLWQLQDRKSAAIVLDYAIERNPDSARLHLLKAELLLAERRAAEALAAYSVAREKRADQASVEAGYAFALHLSGASPLNCIPAYRTAIALNAEAAALKINLAQLLFLIGADEEATTLLRDARRQTLPLNDEVERDFYLLAHTSEDRKVIIDSLKALREKGAKLDWNVKPNIDAVRAKDARRARALELVAEAMSEGKPADLDRALYEWPADK